MQLEQQCVVCLEVKSVTEFNKRGKWSNILRKQCKECVNLYRKEHRKTPEGKAAQKRSEDKYRKTDRYWTPRALYTRSKASAKQRGKSFLLTLEEYKTIRQRPCYYCNDLLKNEKNRGIGLDRLDNNRGYEIDNVVACCGSCNQIRSDQLSISEMKEVAKLLVSLRKLSII